MARDMNTPLDWVAAQHWNTDNPHVHILVRGRTSAGEDLVIDREYMRHGLRWRAEGRATLELGLRSGHDLQAANLREISAERWTGLDDELARIQEKTGIIDLRYDPGEDRHHHTNLLGRIGTLSQLGLALEIEPSQWQLGENAKQTLRSLELRGDIIKSMHKAMSERWPSDLARLQPLQQRPDRPITGRLAHDVSISDPSGGAPVAIDGVDGRRHQIHITDIDSSGDLAAGAIVRIEPSKQPNGQYGLTTISALTLEQQITSCGPTWLDQQLVASMPEALGEGFGQEVRQALTDRTHYLVAQGLGHRENGKIVLIGGLLDELKQRELAEAIQGISRSTGLAALPSGIGDHVAGTCRQEVRLNSGRFAMIDNGMGFQLVPWEPALGRRLGHEVAGVVNSA